MITKPSLTDTELDLIPSRWKLSFVELVVRFPQIGYLFSVPWVGTTYSGRKYDGEVDLTLALVMEC